MQFSRGQFKCVGTGIFVDVYIGCKYISIILFVISLCPFLQLAKINTLERAVFFNAIPSYTCNISYVPPIDTVGENNLTISGSD